MMLVCWCSSLVQPAGCCLLLFPTPGWGLTYHTKYEMTRQDGSFDEILSSSTVISGLAWWWEEIRRYWWLLVNKTRYWLDLLTIILSCLLLEKNIMQILSIPQCCPCCLLFKYWHSLKESKTFSKNSRSSWSCSWAKNAVHWSLHCSCIVLSRQIETCPQSSDESDLARNKSKSRVDSWSPRSWCRPGCCWNKALKKVEGRSGRND